MPEDQIHRAPPWVMRDEPPTSRIPSEMQPVADYLKKQWNVATGQEYPPWVKTHRQQEFYENAMLALGLTSPFKGGGATVLQETEAMRPASRSVEKLEPVGEKALNAASKERGHETLHDEDKTEAPSDQERFGNLLVSPAVKAAMPARNPVGRALRTVSAGEQ